MGRLYRIHENEMLANTHFPVKAMFDMIADWHFKEVAEAISNNRGFGENYGACIFWNDLDDYDKEHTPFYEGAEFGLHSGEDVIVSCKDILYYFEIACAGYCEDHPEDTEEIRGYINDFKVRNHLE